MGVFQKEEGEHPFKLTGYLAVPGKTKEECIESIRENCGWELMVADELEAFEPPDVERLRFLRLFDPERHFIGEIE